MEKELIKNNSPVYGVLNYNDIDLLRDVIEGDNQKYCPEYIKKFIDTKGNIGFTAKLDGKVIGLVYCYSLLNLDGRFMLYIYSVDILSAYQNRGYGSDLIKFVVEYSKTNGYTECFVPVFKNNVRACRIYEKAGMVSSDDVVEYAINHK